MLKILFFLLLITKIAFASIYIPDNQAFKVTLNKLPNNQLDLHFDIASGFHLYKDKIVIKVNKLSKVKIGTAVFPAAIIKHSNIVGDLAVYEETADIILPIEKHMDGNLILDVSYQGCKDLAYCFPPINDILKINLNDFKKYNSNFMQQNLAHKINTNHTNVLKTFLKNVLTFIKTSNSDSIKNFFMNNLFFVLFTFFISGMLLAFTPCVFPMLPILFSIINVNNSNSKTKSFILSLSYVLGISSAYTIAGCLSAIFGYQIQMILQNNIISYIAGLMFIIFSFGLFGIFNLQLPLWLQNKIIIKKPGNISLVTTYLTGVISTLILSPCTTAPIAGALLYIATTGNIGLGASTLFFMGLGSGIPLILISIFGQTWLPKRGIWMSISKDILAFLMLGLSIYVITKNYSIDILFIFLGMLIFSCACYFLFAKKYINLHNKRLFLISNIGLIIFAVYIFFNEFQIKTVNIANYQSEHLKVKTLQELKNKLSMIAQQKKPVILDFYASWCLACKELQNKTLQDSRVLDLLSKFNIIIVDISDNNKQSALLQKYYNVIAPPSIVFIDKNGIYMSKENITGYISSNNLIPILKKMI